MGKLDDEIWSRKLAADENKARQRATEEAGVEEDSKAAIEDIRQRAYRALVEANYPPVRTMYKMTYNGEDRVLWFVGKSCRQKIYLSSTGELLREIPSSKSSKDLGSYDSLSSLEQQLMGHIYYRNVHAELQAFHGDIQRFYQ